MPRNTGFLDTSPVKGSGQSIDDLREAFGLGNTRVGVARDFIRSSLKPSISPLSNLLDGITGGLQLNMANKEIRATKAALAAKNNRIQDRADRVAARGEKMFSQKQADRTELRGLAATLGAANTDAEKFSAAGRMFAITGKFQQAAEMFSLRDALTEKTIGPKAGFFSDISGPAKGRPRGRVSVFSRATSRGGKGTAVVGQPYDVSERYLQRIDEREIPFSQSEWRNAKKLFGDNSPVAKAIKRLVRGPVPPGAMRKATFGKVFRPKIGEPVVIIDKNSAILKSVFDDLVENQPGLFERQRLSIGSTLPEKTAITDDEAGDMQAANERLAARANEKKLVEQQSAAGEALQPLIPGSGLSQQGMAEQGAARIAQFQGAPGSQFAGVPGNTGTTSTAEAAAKPKPTVSDRAFSVPEARDEARVGFFNQSGLRDRLRTVADNLMQGQPQLGFGNAQRAQVPQQQAPQMSGVTDDPGFNNPLIVGGVNQGSPAPQGALPDGAGMPAHSLDMRFGLSGGQPRAESIAERTNVRKQDQSVLDARIQVMLEAQKQQAQQQQQQSPTGQPAAGVSDAQGMPNADFRSSLDQPTAREAPRRGIEVVDAITKLLAGGNKFGGQRMGGNKFGDSAPPRTQFGRTIQTREDGSRFSEISITVTDRRINGGAPTNIPSVFGGIEVSEDQAIRIIAKNNGFDPETGFKLESFGSLQEAVQAARDRSDSIREAK